jgi:outer membrane protein assembly factor BamB
MLTQSQNSRRTSTRSLRTLGILILTGLSFGCADWHEFGHGPTNPHNTFAPGPTAGITSVIPLAHPTPGSSHGTEVGVLTDSSGAYYVTSYGSEIHVYDPTGTYQETYTLPVGGSRAAPYIVNFFLKQRSYIFTGAEGGGFYVIEVDKSVVPYTMTLVASDTTVGVSESSPKRAADGTFYLAEQWGDIIAFSYDFPTATLSRINTYPIGEVITGAIALFDCVAGSPGEEVLVATKEGGFYVLDHNLSGEIWNETSGLVNADEYYSGVTVSERGTSDPIALLPMAGRIESPPSANSGRLRAINLVTQSIEWELTPSATTAGVHEIPGSVSLMHPFTSTVTGITMTTTTPTDNTTVTTTATVTVTPGSDISGTGTVSIETHVGTNESSTHNIENQNNNNLVLADTFLATFASTDEHLYAVDLLTGFEVWAYPMGAPGFDAPVTDRSSVVFVGDGTSTIHAVFGPMGTPVWVDPVITAGGVEDIAKIGLSYHKELIVASGNSAYSLF